mgnify:CR=1 FL=1|jgi:hypothetical protein
MEVAGFGIDVMLVAPGAITSQFGKKQTLSIKLPEGAHDMACSLSRSTFRELCSDTKLAYNRFSVQGCGGPDCRAIQHVATSRYARLWITVALITPERNYERTDDTVVYSQITRCRPPNSPRVSWRGRCAQSPPRTTPPAARLSCSGSSNAFLGPSSGSCWQGSSERTRLASASRLEVALRGEAFPSRPSQERRNNLYDTCTVIY